MLCFVLGCILHSVSLHSLHAVRRPSITVSWEAAPEASMLHAQVASYEVEVVDQTESSSQRPRTGSSGKQTSYTATNLMPGTRYQVHS